MQPEIKQLYTNNMVINVILMIKDKTTTCITQKSVKFFLSKCMSCEGRFHLFYRKRDIVNNPAEANGFGKVVCEWSGLAVMIHIKNEGKKPS